MASYQIFVKLLDGRTQCLQFQSPAISGAAIKRALLARIDSSLGPLCLVSQFREISDTTVVLASSEGYFPSCSLVGRLLGGKGGFGSLLRGAATKAGQKKTNNFDACRDMSGRRLRHVNAEKKLDEWRAEAEERKMEKLAVDFLKEKAKKVKKEKSVDEDKLVKKYMADSDRCMTEVDESVRKSFGLYNESKRKFLPLCDGPDSKRLKIWLGKKKLEDSDSDEDEDSDDQDEKSVVIDDGNMCFEGEHKGTMGGPSSASGSQLDDDNVSSGRRVSKMIGGLGCTGSSSNSNSSMEAEIGGHEKLDMHETSQCDAEFLLSCGGSEFGVQKPVDSVSVNEEAVLALGVIRNPGINDVPPANEIKTDGKMPLLPKVSHTVDSPCMEEPLNFIRYSSASELEVLGMERLKNELQSRGLKCGGTLHERAARLFLLKTTPLDKLPKKFFAKYQ